SGLPPTPIALPGRESIRAALAPAVDSALYFVARGDGSSEFSATLAEHQAAVRRFQLQRRADYRSSPAPDGDGDADADSDADGDADADADADTDAPPQQARPAAPSPDRSTP
ncbi:MAG TPA: endolytic transglycosylase MltG, partial [Pseudomonadales bacterium]|nr:endolytic transglycosylase MltG [Pseudomonadales bacterium]